MVVITGIDWVFNGTRGFLLSDGLVLATDLVVHLDLVLILFLVDLLCDVLLLFHEFLKRPLMKTVHLDRGILVFFFDV